MNPIERKTRSRTMWLMLAMLGSLALTAPAQASVFACHRNEFGSVARTCALNQLICRPIYMSRPGSHWANNLLFFSVSTRNGSPSNKCAIPAPMTQKFVAINHAVQKTTVVGNGNVVVAETSQENNISPKKGRYLLCPASAVGVVLVNAGANITTVIGDGNIVLTSLSQTNDVKLPKNSAGTIVALNIGVNLTTVVGDGNIVTADLTQSNYVN